MRGAVIGVSCVLDEAFDEGERGVGDRAPAVVDGQGVSAVGDLDELGDTVVALLPLVGGLEDGPRDGVVLLPGDDQHRSPVGFSLSTFASVHGFRFAAAAWKIGAPDAGTANLSF